VRRLSKEVLDLIEKSNKKKRIDLKNSSNAKCLCIVKTFVQNKSLKVVTETLENLSNYFDRLVPQNHLTNSIFDCYNILYHHKNNLRRIPQHTSPSYRVL